MPQTAASDEDDSDDQLAKNVRTLTRHRQKGAAETVACVVPAIVTDGAGGGELVADVAQRDRSLTAPGSAISTAMT